MRLQIISSQSIGLAKSFDCFAQSRIPDQKITGSAGELALLICFQEILHALIFYFVQIALADFEDSVQKLLKLLRVQHAHFYLCSHFIALWMGCLFAYLFL